ncbi:MAG: TVP38/TMEM64 family protein [Clostridium sp.]|uniref:TVP38/TMEM64 family protein n=1 Tax=Clostridium sp. TaxID=1506 RepID=UPI003EE64D66
MNEILKLLNTYQEFAIFISVFISVIIAILGIVPSVFVTGANIVFFGPFLGFLISLLGETVGNYVSFRVYKKGLKKGIEEKFSKYKVLDKIKNSSGNKCALLILEGRIIPFVPSGIVTLAASLSSIDDFRYTLATCIGKIPSIGLEVLVSYGVLSSGAKGIQAILGICGVYLIYKTIKKYRGA